MKSYLDKIKSLPDLLSIIGPRPRERTVCMCHGTFDIVHPGHLRHLMYAKDHADILVASVTADRHVIKASFRPYVNETLRARHLAAFEIVDYVIIDDEPTPLKNIAAIQPDYFAKGFEYLHGNPQTENETAAVESYGGQMLFTPGDVVYSSSAITNASPPNIALENLLTTMNGDGVTFLDLRNALRQIRGLNAYVLGDSIVDTVTHGAPTGSIGKTPTLSVQVQGHTDYVGGAAIVARHLRAAGADVTFATVLGNDAHGKLIVDDLEAAGVHLEHLVDTERPTTNKNAVVAAGYRLLKLDTVDSRPVSGRLLERLLRGVGEAKSDLVLFSDFRHGIFNRDTIPALAGAIRAGAFSVADSQVASRWGNILEFQGFDLITPNEKEARHALVDQDSVIRPLASRLYDESGCKTLILKLGERGILTQRAPLGVDHYMYAVGSFARSAVDPVGAGDALVAYASLAKRATGSDLVASILGSIAAGLECERDGNIPITADDVLQRVNDLERASQYGPLKSDGASRPDKSPIVSLPSISSTRRAIVEARG